MHSFFVQNREWKKELHLMLTFSKNKILYNFIDKRESLCYTVISLKIKQSIHSHLSMKKP